MNKRINFAFLFVIVFAGFFIFSCVKKVGKLPPTVPSAPPPPNLCDSAKYTLKIKAIIDAKCATCHFQFGQKSDVPLTNYGEVSAKASRLQVRILDQNSMPPAGNPSVTAAEKDLIKCWLDNGTPQ